jgi:hypothetical protein
MSSKKKKTPKTTLVDSGGVKKKTPKKRATTLGPVGAGQTLTAGVIHVKANERVVIDNSGAGLIKFEDIQITGNNATLVFKKASSAQRIRLRMVVRPTEDAPHGLERLPSSQAAVAPKTE